MTQSLSMIKQGVNEDISSISKNNKQGNNSDRKWINIFKIAWIISSIFLMNI